MVTTRYIMLECGNAAARRPYRQRVDALKQSFEAAGALIDPTAQDWQRAWTQYRRCAPGDAGIVDLVSFEVMRRLSITDVFTNDRHFRAAGFHPMF